MDALVDVVEVTAGVRPLPGSCRLIAIVQRLAVGLLSVSGSADFTKFRALG